MAADDKQLRIYSRPVDPSLEAFKRWIEETTRALGGVVESDITEQEWTDAWLCFWGYASSPSPER